MLLRYQVEWTSNQEGSRRRGGRPLEGGQPGCDSVGRRDQGKRSCSSKPRGSSLGRLLWERPPTRGVGWDDSATSSPCQEVTFSVLLVLREPWHLSLLRRSATLTPPARTERKAVPCLKGPVFIGLGGRSPRKSFGFSEPNPTLGRAIRLEWPCLSGGTWGLSCLGSATRRGEMVGPLLPSRTRPRCWWSPTSAKRRARVAGRTSPRVVWYGHPRRDNGSELRPRPARPNGTHMLRSKRWREGGRR